MSTAAVDNGKREQSLLNSDHAQGKGDKPRCGWHDQYKQNFDCIAMPKSDEGFQDMGGGRKRKVYR